ncbi:MAG TPA: formate--tetrahydrofolate ligase, partial [Firmicutes bacterium]|nr:formate--tetrahydrofolate ligase [Bacillota bacterium]
HGGPFANIAHGCNSVIATKTALSLADYVVTEAGFGSDLGAEKFLDIKCRVGDLNPDAIVVVATIRALKNHGGAEDLVKEDIEALKRGFSNLKVHVENMKNFNKDVVIAINHFESDTPNEIETLKAWCKENSYPFAFTDGFIKGQEGCIELARKVLSVLENSKETKLNFTYNMNDSIKTKIEKIAKNIYRAGSVEYSELAEEQIKEYEKRGYNDFYVCIAKTPQSLSDNAKLMNVPENHTLHVKRINLSTGARFLVPITGSILTMPGLPKVPAAVKMEESDGD